jgi:ribosome-associated heat shock protein Hsp15
VKLNGIAGKAASVVKPGDHIETRTGDRLRALEVTALIEKRAGAAIAAACYVDHSPPPPTKEEVGSPNFARDRGTDQTRASSTRPGAPAVGGPAGISA